MCHVGILLPVLIFTCASSSACHSASNCQISSKSDHSQQSYDFIPIFQDVGHSIEFYFRFRFRRCSSIRKVNIYLLTKFQQVISSHHWFVSTRFLTKVCHVGILLPVSIFSFVSSLGCHSALAYRISSKSDCPRRRYDVIAIFKMAAVSHVKFLQC